MQMDKNCLSDNQSLQRLLSLIKLSVKFNKFSLSFVECGLSTQQQKFIINLKQQCFEAGICLIDINIRNLFIEDFRQTVCEKLNLNDINSQRKVAITVTGLETSILFDIDKERPAVLQIMNLSRENYPKTIPYPLIIFLSKKMLGKVQQVAPDFWSWRNAEPQRLKVNFIEEELEEALSLGQIESWNDAIYQVGLLESLMEDEKINEFPIVKIDLLSKLGDAYKFLERYSSARYCYEKALELKPDKEKYANLLNKLGIVLRSLNYFDIAIEFFKKYLKYSEDNNYIVGKAAALNNIGLIYLDKSDSDRALKKFNEALKVYEEFENLEGKSDTIGNRGLAYQHMNDSDSALKDHIQASLISEGLKNRSRYLKDLINIGDVYFSRGWFIIAAGYYLEAEKVSKKSRDPNYEKEALFKLANCLSTCNIKDEINLIRNNVLTHSNEKIAAFLKMVGRFAGELKEDYIKNFLEFGEVWNPIVFLKRALEISKKIKDEKSECTILIKLASLYRDIGSQEDALKFYEEALKKSQNIKDIQQEVKCYFNIIQLIGRTDYDKVKLYKDIVKLRLKNSKRYKAVILEAWVTDRNHLKTNVLIKGNTYILHLKVTDFIDFSDNQNEIDIREDKVELIYNLINNAEYEENKFIGTAKPSELLNLEGYRSRERNDFRKELSKNTRLAETPDDTLSENNRIEVDGYENRLPNKNNLHESLLHKDMKVESIPDTFNKNSVSIEVEVKGLDFEILKPIGTLPIKWGYISDSLLFQFTPTEPGDEKKLHIYIDVNKIPYELSLSINVIMYNIELNTTTKKYNFYEIEDFCQYGFWGRDIDILEIEDRTLGSNNILLIQGMGGTGKTTLMKHLAWWWQKTDLIGDVCYFAYDKKAYTLEQLLNEICTALMPDYKSYGFHADSLKVQMDTIARYLKENRSLIMLDNLESITGEAMAVKNTLPEEEREKIRKFLSMLKGGKTLVLLGSRSSEPWLSKGTFGKNIYILKGLDEEAATGLATAVLEDIGKSKLKGQEDFNTLLAYLKGYPLAIELVLQNLSHQTPAQVLEGLRKGDVDLDGEGEERTTSILKCVEYSFYFLSEAEQKNLLALAPFATKIMPSTVILYIDKLRESPEWADCLSGEDFDNMLKKAIHWGLASWDSQYDFILHLQPVLSYYLQSRLTGMGSLKQSAEEVFYTHYCNYCKEIYGKMTSKSAEDHQVGFFHAAVEYDNIYRAIQSALDIKKPVSVLYRVIDEFLEKQNEINTALIISRGILEKLMYYKESLDNKDFRNDILSIVNLCGNYSLRLQKYDEAEAYYKKALEICIKFGDEYLQASTYHQLGKVAQDTHNLDEAKTYYIKALEIKIKFGDEYSQTETYHQLGRLAHDKRELDYAEAYYKKALEIDIKFEDEYSQAETYHQLGRLAHDKRELDYAEAYYKNALEIDIKFGDEYSQAKTYHQLGRLAQDKHELDDAEAYYKKALEVDIKFGDVYSQARAYNNLGSIAQDKHELDDAEAYYKKALEIFIKFGDEYSQASTYHNLGSLAKDKRELDDAEAYFKKALEILIKFGDEYSQARPYHQLGSVAQDKRELDEAEAYLKKALEIFIKFGDEYEQASTYHQLGSVAQDKRKLDGAEAYYKKALEIFVKFGAEYEQARTYHQLGSVAQDKRELDDAEAYSKKALEIFIRFGDEYEQASTYHQLGSVAQDNQQEHEAIKYYCESLKIYITHNEQHFVFYPLVALFGLHKANPALDIFKSIQEDLDADEDTMASIKEMFSKWLIEQND